MYASLFLFIPIEMHTYRNVALDGIMNASHAQIIVENITGGNKQKVKAGDKVGRVSSLMNFDIIENQREEWTLEKLRNQVATYYSFCC